MSSWFRLWWKYLSMWNFLKVVSFFFVFLETSLNEVTNWKEYKFCFTRQIHFRGRLNIEVSFSLNWMWKLVILNSDIEKYSKHKDLGYQARPIETTVLKIKNTEYWLKEDNEKVYWLFECNLNAAECISHVLLLATLFMHLASILITF